MKIKDGMRVKISNNLSKTFRECGAGGKSMERMKGRFYDVNIGGVNTSIIYNEGKNFSYTFSNDDLIVIKDQLTQATPPVTFDVNQLDI